MARGQPDYGMYAAKEITASISDMGEVAARLGSIAVYDRRGEVVDFDAFESPVLRWVVSGLGIGYSAKLVSDNVKSWAQAVKLTTPASSLGMAQIARDFQCYARTSLGAEISFSSLSFNGILSILIESQTLTHFSAFRALFNNLTGKLYVDDETETPVEVADLTRLAIVTFRFFTLKVVVDPSTGYYKRVLFNTEEYDINSQAGVHTPTVSEPLTSVYIRLQNTNGDANTAWVDDFIFTQAEP